MSAPVPSRTPPAAGAASPAPAPALGDGAGGPPRLPAVDRWSVYAGLLVLSAAVLVFLTFTDYGITWDEDVQARYGEYVLRWYASGFHDRAALGYLDLVYYGGFFEALAQGLARVSPFALFPTRHLLNAGFGLLGLVGAWRLGRRLEGPAAGFASALFLLLTPQFYGHWFNNSKDVPFAVLYLWSVYFLACAVPGFPRLRRRDAVRIALATGLAMGVRVGGVLLLAYLWAAAALCLAVGEDGHGGGDAEGGAGRPALRLAAGVAGVSAGAWATMLAWWPWGQVSPLRHPLQALGHAARFPWAGTVLFDGREMRATEIPWSYVARWILVASPEFVLLGLLLAAAAGARALARERGRGLRRAVRSSEAWVWVAVVFPMAYAAATHAVLYDGMRHFLFTLPLLATLAAAGTVRAMRRLPRAGAAAVGALAAASLALTAWDMAALHPYEAVYFNRAVAGGVARGVERYDSDYWGNSYREGAEWLARAFPHPPRRLRVASCSAPISTEAFLPRDRFEYVGSLDYGLTGVPDLFLATTRFHCWQRVRGPVIHVVGRLGAPLLYVRRVEAGAPPGGTPATAPAAPARSRAP